MSELNEPVANWVIFAVIIPLMVGALCALPLWWRRKVIVGNLIGSIVIAVAVFVMIWQQYGALVRTQANCSQQWTSNCADITGVSQYTPYLILVLLGWVDVFFLLVISGIVEDRLRPRWLDTSKL